MQNPYDVNASADRAVIGGEAASTAAGFPSPRPHAGMRTASNLISKAREQLASTGPTLPPREPVFGFNPETKQFFSAGQTWDSNLTELAARDQAGFLDVHNDRLPEGFQPVTGSYVRGWAAKERANLGFIDDVQRSVGQQISGAGSAMRDIPGLDGVGQSVEQYGSNIVGNNPARVNSLGEIMDSPFASVQQVAADIGVQLPLMVAGGAAGSVAGPIGTVVGSLAPLVSTAYGQARQAQREQGVEDKTTALASAVGQAALERFIGPEARILSKAAHAPVDLLKSSALKAAGRGVVEEAGTEAAQQVLDRWGSYKDLGSQQAVDEYLFSAAMGGLGGGLLGAGHHGVQKLLAPAPAAPVAPPADVAGIPATEAPVAPAVETPPAPDYTSQVDSLLKLVNPTALDSKKARTFAEKFVASGWSTDPAAEAVREAMSNNKWKRAEAELRILEQGALNGGATPAGPVPTGDGGQPSADGAGSIPVGGPAVADASGGVPLSAEGAVADDAASVPVGSGDQPNAALSGPRRGPALTGMDAPENFTLTRTGGAPSVWHLQQQEDEAPAPQQTDNTSVTTMRETGQQPLFVTRGPSTKKGDAARVLKEKASAAQRQWDKVAAKVGLPQWGEIPPELRQQATDLFKKGKLTPGGIASLKDAFTQKAAAESRETQDNEFISGVDTVPELRLWNAVFGEGQGPFMERLARGETFESVGKSLGVTGDAIRKTVERLNVAEIGRHAAEILSPAEAGSIIKSLEYIKKPAAKRRFEAAAAQAGGVEHEFVSPEQAKDLLTQGAGVRVQSAGNMGVKESSGKKAEGNVDKGEMSLIEKAAKMEAEMKALLKEGKKEEALAKRKEIEALAEAMYGRRAKKGGETSADEDFSDEYDDTDDNYGADDTESRDAIEDDEQDFTTRKGGSLDALANGQTTDVPLARTDFKDGKTAAEYIAKTDTRPWVQWLANLIAPHLKDTKVHFVKAGDDLSATGLPADDKQVVFRAFDRRDLALHLTASNGSHHVFLRLDGKLDHEALMHELLHAATVDAMRAGNKSFDKMAQQIRYALSDLPQWLQVSNEDAATLKHLADQFRKPTEFVAYAFTNPAFQKVLKHLATDGRWVSDYRAPEALARVTEPQPAKVRVPYARPLTMWQKFVDNVRALFGASRKYADAFEAAMAAQTAAQEQNKRAEKVTFKSLRADLEAALTALVEENAAMTAVAGPASADAITSKLPAPLQTAPANVAETLRAWGQTALNSVAFTEDLIARAVTKGISAAKQYSIAERLRATKAGERIRAAEKILEPFNDLSPAEQKKANDFIYSSTRENKWGFTPDWLAKKPAVDPAMAAKYNALLPDTRRFVESVFRHGHQILGDKKALVEKSVGDEFDADIKAAEAKGRDKLAARLKSEKASILERFHTLLRITEGSPYAPLRRTGDWVVTGESPEYAAAKAANDRSKMRELETDPNHYTVSFAETEGEARALAGKLRDAGMESSHRQKDLVLEEMYGGKGMMGALLKVKGQLEGMAEDVSDDEKKALGKLQRTVATMYLNALSEASARKAEMHRRGISGEVDMLKSFATQARSDAQFMASVEYNKQILDAVRGMKKEAFDTKSGDPAEKTKLYNEIMKRYVGTLEDKPSKFADRVTRATSLWMLATSPAYHFFNLTQPFVMSVPYMAKGHTYARAAAGLSQAWKEVADMVGAVNWRHSLNFDQISNRDERAAMENLARLGIIDIGMSSDLGSFQVADRGKFSKAWNRVDDTLRVLAEKVETVNRLSTALAAYRLEMAKSGDRAKAEEYAGKVVTQTHGDYSRANAPRAFNTTFGRIALQFRKFQLIQLTMISKLVKEAMNGASQDEKLAAARALGFITAHMAVLGGMVALPGYALWGAAAAALLGDEGPDDLEQRLRRAIGDKHVADLLTRGVPAFGGVDISSKIGFGNMLSVLPFTDVDPTSRKSVTEIGYALTTGAAGGLALRGADALKYMRGGDYYRGLEAAMPVGVMNALKAGRVATQGVTNSRGDVLLTPDEVNAAKSIAMALGFTPTSEARRQASSSFHYGQDTYFKDRANALAKQYAEAVRAGRSTARIVEDWRSMQQAMRNAQLVPTPFSTLYRAPAQQAMRERNTSAEGVQFRKGNRAAILQDAE